MSYLKVPLLVSPFHSFWFSLRVSFGCGLLFFLQAYSIVDNSFVIDPPSSFILLLPPLHRQTAQE